MSGIDLPDGRQIRKGAPDTVIKLRQKQNGQLPDRVQRAGRRSRFPRRDAAAGLRRKSKLAGMVVLEDILKPGMRDRFERLRRMGLRTVMVTGDNPLTAKAIAEQAGVDAFIAQATPEAKLDYIRKEQAGGKLVAMMGDGTNDAPALAQADVGVAMNSGTQAAKEAGNMVDLDSDPTKLIEVVEIGKQLLMTRGALDHVLDRQRPGQVLRHRAGPVRRDAPLAQDVRRHAPALGHVGHPVGRDFQRDHHSAVDSDRPERGGLQAGGGRRPACGGTCWSGAWAA